MDGLDQPRDTATPNDVHRLKELVDTLECLTEKVELKMAQLGHVESQFEFQAAELHQLQEDQRRNEGSARSHRISASQKDDRIEELEEALRESVRITADREMALHNETQLRIQISEKVARMEQRLESFRNAQSLKCSDCRPNRHRVDDLQKRLDHLLAERRSHLHELFDMKQEALEAAISERDAQLALLEVTGIKTARIAQQVDDLKADRKRLMQLMKHQNEKRVELLQEYQQLPAN